MTLYERLLEQFGYNEPIFLEEIMYESYSKTWIGQKIKVLCEEGSIARFDRGIYYIPFQTPFGISTLNPRKVIEKRYIRSPEGVYGYYSGQILLNQLGISTQMPNILEIYTNNESARTRDLTIGRQKVRVRKSRVNIDNDNAPVLRFLELMNVISARELDENAVSIIKRYVLSNNIRQKDITLYAPKYPDKVMRNLIESELIYHVSR